ncbi:hypothetical protein EVAR_73476_1 [Eumeta japonica]|uniref:CHK kinase-like domain-containing protein n=1 Tax=Eumeta variegata TaxID=151549 RepID=A0A4C1T1V5_EUMVA|nr:hypothetical protein EVAR_73476_1 [Eumeta japonica]
MSHPEIPNWIKPHLFEKALRATVNNFKQITKFKVSPALAPGENYATFILKIQVEVELTSGLLKKQSFILKVAHDNELYHREMSTWGLFTSETGMYRSIKPEFEELYAQVGLNVTFGARSYELPVNKEYVLLEDLTRRGFKNAKRQDCLDMEHCQAVLKKIAQFHAASAVRVERNGMFAEPYLYGFLKDEMKDLLQTVVETSLPHLTKSIENLENHQDYLSQVTKFAANAADIVFGRCAANDSDFNVLNHGFVTIITVMGSALCDPTVYINLDDLISNSKEGEKFMKLVYSNDRFIKHLKLLLPWLYNRGALEC